jgi:tRNA threonylcarbamoyladenosine biosynthesis protein TsaE
MAVESEFIVVETTSAESTEALAERIGRAAYPGLVLALDGELGAGKTCFARGLARGLDVHEAVSSPTFALQHVYSGRHELWHFDAWRAGPERALLGELGPAELSREAVVLVEWAERVADLLPLPRLEVRIEHVAPQTRRVRFRWSSVPFGTALPASAKALCEVLASIAAAPADAKKKTATEPAAAACVDPRASTAGGAIRLDERAPDADKA